MAVEDAVGSEEPPQALSDRSVIVAIRKKGERRTRLRIAVQLVKFISGKTLPAGSGPEFIGIAS